MPGYKSTPTTGRVDAPWCEEPAAFCVCDEGIINSWVPPPATPAGAKRAVGSSLARCYCLCYGRADTNTSGGCSPTQSLAGDGAAPSVGGSWSGERSHTEESRGCPNFYFVSYFDFHSCSCPLAWVILGCGERNATGMGTLGEGFGGHRQEGSNEEHKGGVGDADGSGKAAGRSGGIIIAWSRAQQPQVHAKRSD